MSLSNWFIFAVIGSVFFGIQAILFKFILNKGLNFTLLTTYFFTITTFLLWIYTFTTQNLALPNKEIMVLLIVSSLLAVIGNLAFFKSLNLVKNAGYTQAVGSLSIVVSFILSIFLFNLKLDFIGIAGIITIIVGVILLSKVI